MANEGGSSVSRSIHHLKMERSRVSFFSTGIDSRRRIIRYRYRNPISKRYTQGLVTLIADHAHRLTMLSTIRGGQTITVRLLRMLDSLLDRWSEFAVSWNIISTQSVDSRITIPILPLKQRCTVSLSF